MRKSLAIIASALLLAVAATATHDRLRYDSTVFSDQRVTGAPRTVRVEYPPCVKGVREDRCIQLYERGVRRSYDRWLASHGRSGERTAAATPARPRAYPRCRGRSDDRCQQRPVARARTARRATPQRARPQQAQRRPAARAVARRPAARPATRVIVRQQARPAPRQRPGTSSSRPRPTNGGTPGI